MFQQSHHSSFSTPADESRGNLNRLSGSRPFNGLLYHGLLTVNPSSRVTKTRSLTELNVGPRNATGVFASSYAGIGRAKIPVFGDGDVEIGWSVREHSDPLY